MSKEREQFLRLLQQRIQISKDKPSKEAIVQCIHPKTRRCRALLVRRKHVPGKPNVYEIEMCILCHKWVDGVEHPV